MPEIQYADPAARRRVLLLFAVVLVVMLPLAWAGDRWLDGVLALERTEARAALAIGLRRAVAAVALLLIAYAAHVFRHGRRIARTGRFPPPGVSVIRDTVVLEGDAARRRALLIQAIACCLAVLALLLTAAAFYLAARLD
jgi:hypothetical protein